MINVAVMRIIGGSDYYDSAASWGQDSSLVFRRDQGRGISGAQLHGEMHVPAARCAGGLVAAEEDSAAARKRAATRYRPLADIEISGARHVQRAGQVLFSGTLYRGICVMRPNEPDNRRWFWSMSALRKFAEDTGLTLHQGQYYAGTHQERSGLQRQLFQYPLIDLPLEAWFTPVVLSGAAREAIVTAGITIASYDPDRPAQIGDNGRVLDWAVDQPTLGDMGFVQCLDPFTAFQEITQWIGGVLTAPMDSGDQISDAVKLAKHGFDDGSFRRPKQTKHK